MDVQRIPRGHLRRFLDAVREQDISAARAIGERSGLLELASRSKVVEERVVSVDNEASNVGLRIVRTRYLIGGLPCADPRQRAPQPVSIVLMVRKTIRTSSHGEKYLM